MVVNLSGLPQPRQTDFGRAGYATKLGRSACAFSGFAASFYYSSAPLPPLQALWSPTPNVKPLQWEYLTCLPTDRESVADTNQRGFSRGFNRGEDLKTKYMQSDLEMRIFDGHKVCRKVGQEKGDAVGGPGPRAPWQTNLDASLGVRLPALPPMLTRTHPKLTEGFQHLVQVPQSDLKTVILGIFLGPTALRAQA